ncbi:MAG TPA: exonuclease SbcCD subunit D C-terminal domain-containing protein [Kiritimatiellia bacterium]|nr:exonuclease SbcCD subunit D C-terminal domain-containing protein [Kiritimatiellia bacterium]HPS07723.1 exonuclease SbcCD subunit D C-terminal domain-containing protein [Kiritimatiellia bacterium]
MKILHTSDWHLGGKLHEQDRSGEHERFLAWLAALLREERPDALVIAGDVFDTFAPSNRALELYYSFLGEIFKSSLCRAVVAVGGNHDSPSLLDSPEKVLIHLHAHVVGAAAETPAQEVVWVPGADADSGLAIGAVPYLREGDLRCAAAGESEEERAARLQAGFRAHYAAVAEAARALSRAKAGRDVPLVLTGHCCLSTAKLSDDHSERARTIGGLDSFSAALLPPADYVALGHLHLPQAVGGNPACRYAGSPLPMSFAEAQSAKSVALVTFGAQAGEPVDVRTVPVPVFQKLEQVSGAPEAIAARLAELTRGGEPVWADVQVTEGEGELAAFWDSLSALVRDTPVKILTRRNNRPGRSRAGRGDADTLRLDTLTPAEVFRMRLAEEALTDGERADFAALFNGLLRDVAAARITAEGPT